MSHGDSEKSRDIIVPPPEFENSKDQPFCDNSVITSHYTLLNFLPKNLFEQFRRLANFYFLIIIILEYFPFSPLVPTFSLLPLLFVLGLTALREAFEDYQRHKSDREINNANARVFKDGEFRDTKWIDIQVGDIIKIQTHEFFPADIFLLSSSEPQSMCYIDTCNLDGETNLKVRQGLREIAEFDSELTLGELSAEMHTEKPNNNLDNFDGNFTVKGQEKLSLSNNQILLRGCALKNTKWIIGIVVFTGKDTKLVQNSKESPSKRSTIEIQLNPRLITIFGFLGAIGLIGAILGGMWQSNWSGKAWYMGDQVNDSNYLSGIWIGVFGFFSFLIVCNVMIPISLYVTLELVKLAQSYFLNWDVDMYHDDTDTPMKARTSNLTEDLGLIDYIFSDKTGTLTCNVMEFMKCTVGGISYGNGITEVAMAAAKRRGIKLKGPKKIKGQPAFQDDSFLKNLESHETSKLIHEFNLMMGICHTVIPEKDPEEPDNYDKIKYQAASPDEGALVDAARMFGYTFYDRTPTSINIEIQGESNEYELLNVLEFNSTRKRMSVIVKTPEGKIMLYCKGADNIIYERLVPNQEYADATLDQLEVFAAEGLRTLCFAYREVEEKEYLEWNHKFKEANTAIEDRKKKVMTVCEQMEKNLLLVGASAIEDKLQEGVPDAIEYLMKGGIKVWVLTGDKQETAINIGFACSLLTNDMTLAILAGNNEEDLDNSFSQAEDQLKENKEIGKPFAIVINGKSLRLALNKQNKRRFFNLGKDCAAVVCCRVSPLQKSEVVDLVRDFVEGSVTLAIGDGANDVSMIQAAHVGIGISGQEGMQAVMSSDYAIAQFRFLRKLLLVHGRWNYRRVTKLILYSFYKNMAFSFMQVLFGIYSSWSAQTLFPALLISVFNVFFTSLPILVMGIFDQDVSSKSEWIHPQLYSTDNRKGEFTLKRFWIWLIEGLYHSCVMFYIPFFIYRITPTRLDGIDDGFWVFSIIIYTSVVFVVNLKLAIETTFWTWMHHFTIWGSIAVWFLLIFIISTFNSLKGIATKTFSNPNCWLSLVIVNILALGPDVIFKYIRRNYFPQNFHVVQERERLGLEYKKKSKDGSSSDSSSSSTSSSDSDDVKLNDLNKKSGSDQETVSKVNTKPSTVMVNGKRSKRRGFAFSPDNGGSARITDPERATSQFRENALKLLGNKMSLLKNLKNLKKDELAKESDSSDTTESSDSSDTSDKSEKSKKSSSTSSSSDSGSSSD
ncbi:putative phospholipid-transporting atpase [Anaeramoeba flamelloides]|uniref:Phospholipid-transporting ATPase n=1 Tax=Anaeramoeba flamelloides TaxID=1746091 RepID=A0ABQ8XJB8_9EUKA|nr:putative phospholipid-transporting atpase [Anaeramoeba flamelloides]